MKQKNTKNEIVWLEHFKFWCIGIHKIQTILLACSNGMIVNDIVKPRRIKYTEELKVTVVGRPIMNNL
jgi:hypothetical protein